LDGATAVFKRSANAAATTAVAGKTFGFDGTHRTRGVHFKLIGLVEFCAKDRDGAVEGAPEHCYNDKQLIVYQLLYSLLIFGARMENRNKEKCLFFFKYIY